MCTVDDFGAGTVAVGCEFMVTARAGDPGVSGVGAVAGSSAVVVDGNSDTADAAVVAEGVAASVATGNSDVGGGTTGDADVSDAATASPFST